MKNNYQYTPIANAVFMAMALVAPFSAQAQVISGDSIVQGIDGIDSTGTDDVQNNTGNFDVQGNLMITGGQGVATNPGAAQGGNASLDVTGDITTSGKMVLRSVGGRTHNNTVDATTTATSGDAQLRVTNDLVINDVAFIGVDPNDTNDYDYADENQGGANIGSGHLQGGNTQLDVGRDMRVIGDMYAATKIAYAASEPGGQADTISGNTIVDIARNLTVGNSLSIESGKGSYGQGGKDWEGSAISGEIRFSVGGDLHVNNQLNIMRGESYALGGSEWLSGAEAGSGKVEVAIGKDAIIGTGLNITTAVVVAEGGVNTVHRATGSGVQMTVGRDMTVLQNDATLAIAVARADDYNSASQGTARAEDMRFSVGRNMTVAAGGMFVHAGDAERQNSTSLTSSAQGGSIIVDVSGTLTINGATGLNVTSGKAITTNAPMANITPGNVSITAAELITSKMMLTQNDGGLTARFDALNMSNNSTNLLLDNTVAWNGVTGVQIGDLIFGTGRELTVTSSRGGGMLGAGNITVLGDGATYASSVAYDASGKTLRFILPTNIANNDVMLNAQQAEVNVAGATTVLQASDTLRQLKGGDKVILISHTAGNIANQGLHNVDYGASRYIFDVKTENDQLIAALNNNGGSGAVTVPEFAKAYAEGLLAPTVALNNSTDLMLSTGYAAAEQTLLSGKHLFLVGEASQIKVNTGSHIRSDGYNFVGGITFALPVSNGQFTIAPLVEFGKGNYDSHNSFNQGSIHGNGDTKYWGGGVLARFLDNSGFYAEGSLRSGRTKTGFSSNDMGLNASYDTKSNYYSAHTGMGYVQNIQPQDQLDTSLKVLWTRQSGDSIITNAYESLDYDAITTLRSRLGTRYTHQINEEVKLFGGLAWEYEFKGRVDARLNGFKIDRPDMSGHTGILETGLNWQATDKLNLYLSFHGFAGQRKGASGEVRIHYAF